MTQSHISLPVSTATFLTLIDFLRTEGSDRDPVEVVEVAIRYWMDNAAWKQEDLMPEVLRAKQQHGYPWRKVMLPHGTKIQVTYKKQPFYAEIIDGHFVHDGRSMSPSEFVKEVSGTTRSAWKELFVRRPGDRTFMLADVLRQEQEAADAARAGRSQITLKSLGLPGNSDAE